MMAVVFSCESQVAAICSVVALGMCAAIFVVTATPDSDDSVMNVMTPAVRRTNCTTF